MTILTISKPTKQQIKHGVERVLATFLVASAIYIHNTNFVWNYSLLHGAAIAGCLAVWQLVVSFSTQNL